jgi:hypothetical protein
MGARDVRRWLLRGPMQPFGAVGDLRSGSWQGKSYFARFFEDLLEHFSLTLALAFVWVQDRAFLCPCI